jgi:hypothetical protein
MAVRQEGILQQVATSSGHDFCSFYFLVKLATMRDHQAASTSRLKSVEGSIILMEQSKPREQLKVKHIHGSFGVQLNVDMRDGFGMR